MDITSSPDWVMATDLKRKLPFHRRLFLLLLLFFGLLLGCFIAFQHGREKYFKAERLDARLQLFNLRLLDALESGSTPAAFIDAQQYRTDSLRVTIVALDGEVIYDSAHPSGLPNHRNRSEIAQALRNGTGYTIRRQSESTDQQYFYSAMRGDSLVVRSALPYSLSLSEMLAADRGFIWIMLGITLLMSLIGYIVTRRLGHNITRLRNFAERAERGEEMGGESFPHDELGDISAHIVRLYAQLQKTTAERDRQHALVLFEEQEKIRIKKQLTNNINHELKTPVAAIQGYLETILANPNIDAAQRIAFLEKSAAQTSRLRSLLTDISTITRMDEASELIQKEPVDLNDIIDEIRADIHLLPEERHIRIHCNFPRPLIVEGNPALLGSIFRNLTDNAIAYSSGRDIYIELTAEDDERYTFLFADNGIGIDPEHLSRIFERFYRIDTGRSRKVGGTGLGLSIVRNAVSLHGGSIDTYNREKGGLEFRFTLCKKG